jgi:hypothetical protein
MYFFSSHFSTCRRLFSISVKIKIKKFSEKTHLLYYKDLWSVDLHFYIFVSVIDNQCPTGQIHF